MASFLISLAVLLGPPVVVFMLIAGLAPSGGVGAQMILAVFVTPIVFLVCAVVVGLNYAWLGWW